MFGGFRILRDNFCSFTGDGFDFDTEKLSEDIENPEIRMLSVPADDGVTATFPIRANKIGQIELQATATTGSGGATDASLRRLRVEPEGTKLFYTTPVAVEVDPETSFFEQTVDIIMPRESDNFVPKSEGSSFHVTGDILGSTINGLGNLVRMPYGCGEQNLVNFVPTVMVRRYLDKTNRLDDDLDETTELFIRSGYQRQLRYRHNDGSYSAFGERDRYGSTWLTAFVLKSFLQADDVVEIDEAKTRQSVRWLIDQQKRGEFIEKGKVLSKR